MPDLDQIKQGEQGARGPARAVRQGPIGQSRRPAARLPRPRQPHPKRLGWRLPEISQLHNPCAGFVG